MIIGTYHYYPLINKNAEVADLTQKKSRLYGSLQTLKAEVQKAEAVKKCVEQAVQPEQTKAKTQNKRRDMELCLRRISDMMAVLKDNKNLEVVEEMYGKIFCVVNDSSYRLCFIC